MENSQNKTAVIYARVSSTGDRQSTDRQVSDLTKFAEKEEIKVVRVFEEHISGAKKIEEREILQQCLDYCVKQNVTYLLLSELSRLGRSTLQVLRSLEILHEAKVCVYVQNLGLYSLMPDGKVNPIASIMITVLAEMSAIERQNITERLRSGYDKHRSDGGKVGRKQGYRKSDDKYQEEYANAIRLLKKGYSVRDVAKIEGKAPSTIQIIKNKYLNNK